MSQPGWPGEQDTLGSRDFPSQERVTRRHQTDEEARVPGNGPHPEAALEPQLSLTGEAALDRSTWALCTAEPSLPELLAASGLGAQGDAGAASAEEGGGDRPGHTGFCDPVPSE